ncbi:MAG TPA: hypothetical protein VGI64_22920, partial [Streptosporangiaceae bacterium]
MTRRDELSGRQLARDSSVAAGERQRTGPAEVGADQVSGRADASATAGRPDTVGRPDAAGYGEQPEWLARRLSRLAASLPSAPGYAGETERVKYGTSQGERRGQDQACSR